jgi:hypothetical protein
MKWIILLLPFNCYGWSEMDTYRESTWQVINFIDYRQTSDISEPHYEQNPLLGKHPSQGKIDKYFAVSAIGHFGASELLPLRYRNGWQWLTIGISGAIVYHNYKIGLKVNF